MKPYDKLINDDLQDLEACLNAKEIEIALDVKSLDEVEVQIYLNGEYLTKIEKSYKELRGKYDGDY